MMANSLRDHPELEFWESGTIWLNWATFCSRPIRGLDFSHVTCMLRLWPMASMTIKSWNFANRITFGWFMAIFALDQSQASISVMWPACSDDGQWPQWPSKVGILQIGPHLADLWLFCSRPIRSLDSGHMTHKQNCSQWHEGSLGVGILQIRPYLAAPEPKISGPITGLDFGHANHPGLLLAPNKRDNSIENPTLISTFDFHVAPGWRLAIGAFSHIGL